jgi:transcriptional regulator with XRE-family HTH domain
MKNYDLSWARTHSGLTQQEASEKMGVDRKTFNRWENNTVAIPAVKMAKFLRLVGVTAASIPSAPDPKYLDGELVTPYLPMRLQDVAQADWPASDSKQWAKSMAADVDGLVEAWRANRWDDYGHDEALAERKTNLEWANNGWLKFIADGSYLVTSEGREHERIENMNPEDLI